MLDELKFVGIIFGLVINIVFIILLFVVINGWCLLCRYSLLIKNLYCMKMK